MRQRQQHTQSETGLSEAPSNDDSSVGNLIGENDPFEFAYVQPVIRASPTARPEQPFPPEQLGREEVLLGNNAGSTVGMIGEEDFKYDESATVRVKYHNQHERRLLNRYWKDQLKQHGNKRIFHILIGEESGNLTCGRAKSGPSIKVGGQLV